MTAFKYSAATLALLFASSMAYAQSSTTTQPQPGADNKIECPAPGSVAEADMPVECKAKGNTSATEMPKPDNSTTGGTTTATETDTSATSTTQVPKQDKTATESTVDTDPSMTGTTDVPKQDNQTATGETTTPNNVATGTTPVTVNAATAVLASQFMGQTVYSSSNENVGEINDLVMNKELDNVVAVIGVGGFLGIGEKDVAIPIDQITVVKDDGNNMRLTIAATKEQLEAAPNFDRTALK